VLDLAVNGIAGALCADRRATGTFKAGMPTPFSGVSLAARSRYPFAKRAVIDDRIRFVRRQIDAPDALVRFYGADAGLAFHGAAQRAHPENLELGFNRSTLDLNNFPWLQ